MAEIKYVIKKNNNRNHYIKKFGKTEYHIILTSVITKALTFDDKETAKNMIEKHNAIDYKIIKARYYMNGNNLIGKEMGQ